MFLEFFIWGAWFELGFDYIPKLGFEEWQLTLIFAAFNIGALAALFFSTQFADRTFAAERFLAFSQLVGGLAILGLFFLPGRLGTQPGEYLSVKASKPGDKPGSAIGYLEDGTKVVIDGVDIDWGKTDQSAQPVVTAVVTEVQATAPVAVIHATKS